MTQYSKKYDLGNIAKNMMFGEEEGSLEDS